MAWFEFSQNNSGGSFHQTDELAHLVFIEAETAELANAKLEDIGGYFDGCEDGRDCPCCGDRWHPAYSALTFPLNWDLKGTVFNSMEEYAKFLAENYGFWTEVDSYLHYADGSKRAIKSPKK